LLSATEAAKTNNVSSNGILVETFLSGREFTVGLLGTGKDAWVVGVDEIIWKGRKRQNGAFIQSVISTEGNMIVMGGCLLLGSF
jgi:predicted ATP-grasp superfamily ATP-dependent carboligase